MAEPLTTQIRRAAMDLLARREHSRRELLQKLQKRFERQLSYEKKRSRALGEALMANTSGVDSAETPSAGETSLSLNEQIEQQITLLTEEGLQSDERFAGSYLRTRIQRGNGLQRIRMELRERGVSDQHIQQALSTEADVDWFELALEVKQKRFGVGSTRDLKERAKRVRFLQYRGFSRDEIDYALEDYA